MCQNVVIVNPLSIGFADSQEYYVHCNWMDNAKVSTKYFNFSHAQTSFQLAQKRKLWLNGSFPNKAKIRDRLSGLNQDYESLS